MRISTAFQYDSYTADISNSMSRINDLQNQITTGKRILKPSDDPMGLTSVLSQTSVQNRLKQYNSNLSGAKTTLQFTDSTLNSVSNIIDSAYSVAVNGANGTNDAASRGALASQISSLQDQLLNLANAKGANGQYLFGGQKNASVPFSLNNNALTYNGDGNPITVESGPTSTLTVNTPGQQLFQNAYSQLENLKNYLTGNDTSSISGVSIDALKTIKDTVSQTRGDVGARLQTVSQLSVENQQRIDELTKSISGTQDVDMTQAITQYQLAQTAYQAALSVASHGFGLSLMDYIK
ncbi:MAG: flagellar hook-associated protein FlgL [Armatimonadetes bacterium]|nr:flagellar hook-associated protein FlgL [Armatimonadota bacterium]